MKEFCKTGSIKLWLYNPQISPESARDLYRNDIKIGLVFAEDKLCSSVLHFGSVLQHEWLITTMTNATCKLTSSDCQLMENRASVVPK